MFNKSDNAKGFSTVSLLVGASLLSIAVAGAIKVLGIGLGSTNEQNHHKLVDQVNRISEAMVGQLNRGGSSRNPEVEAQGIQICSLADHTFACNGYNPDQPAFCLSIPSRVTRGGQDFINVTGFRLSEGRLDQKSLSDVNMAAFNHGSFCNSNIDWISLNNPQDFTFNRIRFCRFHADTVDQVSRNYDTGCESVIENNQVADMFWIALFQAESGQSANAGIYEEARIVHLLNRTRVRIGS